MSKGVLPLSAANKSYLLDKAATTNVGYLNNSQVLKVKVKSSMARSLPVENLLSQNVGSIINYLQ